MSKPGGKRKGAGRPPLAAGLALTEMVRVRLTVAEKVAADLLARHEDRSVSDLGRAAIQLAIARGTTR